MRPFTVLARRLIAGLARAQSSHRTLAGVLLGYWALWTAYAIISKSSQGIHGDMGEVAAWGFDLQWGTPKHPPFLPVLVRLWFSIFPMTEWAYYLLAVGLAVVGIYFSWLLSGYFLHGVKRAVVPFLLMLVPFYNFLALRLDHNVVLIPVWAITTYAFFRGFKTQSNAWSIATGIAAGIAVLAKYWSFFLLLGLIVAALLDKRRLEFLRSPAPWIMTAVSFGVVLPHLLWLDNNGFPTFLYAQHRFAETWSELAGALANYTFGSVAYVAAPLVMLAILVRPTQAALWDTLVPPEGDRRFVAMIFWVPLVAAIPFAIVTSTGVNGLWTMSELSLFGVVLLSSPLIRLAGSAAAVIAMAAMAFSVAALLASPVVAFAKFYFGIENDAAYTRQLAVEVSRIWRATTPQPLRVVAGLGPIANSVVFYIDTHPLPITLYTRIKPWWNMPEGLHATGAVVICPADDASCAKARGQLETGLTVDRRVDVTVVPRWLTLSGVPQTFTIDIVLPEQP